MILTECWQGFFRRDPDSVATVASLFGERNELAVLRRVISVNVDAFDCQTNGIAVGIGKFLEVLKALPLLAHLYATAAIVVISNVAWSLASVAYSSPNIVEWSP